MTIKRPVRAQYATRLYRGRPSNPGDDPRSSIPASPATVGPNTKILISLDKFLRELTTNPSAVLKTRSPHQTPSGTNILIAPDLDKVDVANATCLSQNILARILKDQICERLRILCVELNENQRGALNNYMDFCDWTKTFQGHIPQEPNLSGEVEIKYNEIVAQRKTQLESLLGDRIVTFIRAVFDGVHHNIGQEGADEVAEAYTRAHSEAARQLERGILRGATELRQAPLELAEIVQLRISAHPLGLSKAAFQQQQRNDLLRAGTQASIRSLNVLLKRTIQQIDIS